MRALIIDNGECVGFAERLAQQMDVGYFSTWADSFPQSREMAPGFGIEGVERVNQPLLYLSDKKPDLVCIPHLNNEDFEQMVRAKGIPTFGSGEGNKLENDRWFLKEFISAHGLSLMESEEVEGIDALREYLEEAKNKDKWIKVSILRGDMQTFHHKQWSSTSVWLNDLTKRLGPIGRNIRFIIEDNIPDAIEVSVEGIFVHDTLLTPFMVGYEIKDAGEAGFLCDSVAALPTSIQKILNALSEYFGKTEFRNFFAIEIRLTPDGTAYLIDVAARLPTPPGNVLMAALDDFGQTIWEAANGRAVGSFGKTKYLTEIELKSPWIFTDYLQVHCSPDCAERVAFNTYCKLDDETWILPQMPPDPESVEFGSAFGFGPDLETAAEECKEAAEAVEAYQLRYDAEVLEKAQEEIAKGEKMGIKP